MATIDTNLEPEADDTLLVAQQENLTTDALDPTIVPETPARRRGMSVFAGLVLGGVLAASTGFYAARYVVPEGWPFPGVTAEPNPIAVEQIEQAERLAVLEAGLTEQSALLLELQADKTAQMIAQQAIADLEIAKSKLAEMDALVAAMNSRLTEVEKMPEGSGSEAAEIAAAAYARELSGMREMLASELARIEAQGLAARTLQKQATTTAQNAAIQAAIANIRGALDSGLPFTDALNEISTPIPTGLLVAAENGVVTLPTLQDAFPKAARSALDVSIQAGIDDGSVGRVAGFFRRQLGARSLEPKEGNGPDAILSRAEAALKTGNITLALQEIAALPKNGRAEMADWGALAQQRIDAIAAIETLATQVNGE